MNDFERRLQQTEQRYRSRSRPREVSVQQIEAGNLLAANDSVRVKRRLEELKIAPATARAVEATRAAVAPVGGTAGSAGDAALLERILGKSDLVAVSFLARGLAAARAVGRIHIRNRSGQTIGFGTGSLVSPDLLMTNNHVLAEAPEAETSQVEFDYQVDLDGRPAPSTFFRLAPDRFFLTDDELDYTLVAVGERVSGTRERAELGWSPLREGDVPVLKGEYVSIIQHPNGEPKQLAVRENEVIDFPDPWLHYRTDTAPGSSGSPVFNDQWQLVALHHSGVPRRDAEGRILARDGRPWEPAMGDHRIDWIANEGAQLDQIVRHIQNQPLSEAERPLRAAIFEAEHPSVRPATATDASNSTMQQNVGGFREAVVDRDGGVTWTIPLRVTVRLGDSGSPVTGGVRPGEAPVDTVSKPPVESSDLEQALRELEASRDRPYYDRERDEAARTAYYEDIDATAPPRELFEQLSRLVRETHSEKPSYKPSVHVYPWVDLHPDRKLRSIYSGRTFDPVEFIREDAAIEARRVARLRELLTTEAAVGFERLADRIDALEAQLPYNCEHVVPQSWFGKREPMRGDLHHLFACESGCNSFRGNIPYDDFEDFEEALREACGKREGRRFEPNAGKGAVARATLYFLLRYPGDVNDVEQEFEESRLPILLRWHAEHPVDDYELHRNAAVFEKQGNRNPLIDRPEWAEAVDFREGIG